MPLVAGVDSSTQSCKVVVRDAETGRLVRRGFARHPDGTEIEPEHWWSALELAIAEAGGLADVEAMSVGGQQHGMVVLDSHGDVIRPALLWNDTRSAEAAEQLIVELGNGDRAVGAQRWADAVGTLPVAALTVAKLRWLADHEPNHAAAVAAIALPHDWLTWKLSGAQSVHTLATDRSDASGTGYFDPVANEYRRDLLALALRRTVSEIAHIVLPRVLGPNESAGTDESGQVLLGPGCGDNAGAALGLDLRPGQTSVSLGTSGVVACVSETPTADPSGIVAGFADATGRFLPLACTLNGARVLDATAALLGVDHDALSELALAADPGAGGLVHVPYLEGERTPNLPSARGELHGMTLSNTTRPNLARAAVEGVAGLLGAAIVGLRALDVPVSRVILVGGGARSEAVRQVGSAVWGVSVDVPTPGEDVADGAARQAAWVLAGSTHPPAWVRETKTYESQPTPHVQHAYDIAAARIMNLYRTDTSS